jgi:hypothetical protein
MQEIYNDACSQINDAQKIINELSNSTIPEDVDDITKIAKEKSNAQKIKDSGIKIKLEVAKLQADIIKHKGDLDELNQERANSGAVTLDDFKELREILNNNKKEMDE